MDSPESAVPCVYGVHHVGLTVPDIETAIGFLQNILGARPLVRIGRIEANGTWMRRHLGVDATTRIERMAVLRLANGANLELFEYSADEQTQIPSANSDIGGHHVLF